MHALRKMTRQWQRLFSSEADILSIVQYLRIL